MRTDPSHDAPTFLIADYGDQTALGPRRRVLMALFCALMLGTRFVAAWR